MLNDRDNEHRPESRQESRPSRPDDRRDDRRAAPIPRARLSGYLLSWIALAAFAFGYIGVAATRPDLLPGVIPLNDQANEQLAGGRSVGDLADEIASLRKWVNDLQHEMLATKNALQSSEQQQHALLQRMSLAEDRLPPVREIRAEQPAPQTRARTADSKPSQAVASAPPVEEQPAVVATASTAGIKLINGNAASEIVTSSVTPGGVSAPASAPSPPAYLAAKAPASATVATTATAGPASGPPERTRGIEIADSETLDGLRSRWAAISSQNAGVLKRLEPRYKISSSANSQNPFTLLAGPFPSTADAARTCAQLKANGVSCRVSDYAGNGL